MSLSSPVTNPVRHATPVRHAAAAFAPLAVLVALLVAVSGCGGGSNVQTGPGGNDTNYIGGSVGTTAFKTGQRPAAPPVSGRTLTGQPLSLRSYRGKIVVLNFWASWCAPCRAEAPVLARLSRAYQAKGVQFIGINIKDPGRANGEAFERNFAIKYPSLYDPAGQILLAFRNTVPPAAIPSTLVIDRTGHIAARIIGGATYSGLNSLLSWLTTGRSPSGENR